MPWVGRGRRSGPRRGARGDGAWGPACLRGQALKQTGRARPPAAVDAPHQNEGQARSPGGALGRGSSSRARGPRGRTPARRGPGPRAGRCASAPQQVYSKGVRTRRVVDRLAVGVDQRRGARARDALNQVRQDRRQRRSRPDRALPRATSRGRLKAPSLGTSAHRRQPGPRRARSSRGARAASDSSQSRALSSSHRRGELRSADRLERSSRSGARSTRKTTCQPNWVSTTGLTSAPRAGARTPRRRSSRHRVERVAVGGERLEPLDDHPRVGCGRCLWRATSNSSAERAPATLPADRRRDCDGSSPRAPARSAGRRRARYLTASSSSGRGGPRPRWPPVRLCTRDRRARSPWSPATRRRRLGRGAVLRAAAARGHRPRGRPSAWLGGTAEALGTSATSDAGNAECRHRATSPPR